MISRISLRLVIVLLIGCQLGGAIKQFNSGNYYLFGILIGCVIWDAAMLWNTYSW